MKSLLVYCCLAFILISSRCATGKQSPKPALNGHSFEGWSAADMKYWSIEDSAIIGHITDTLESNQFLWSSETVSDFYLSVDIKQEPAECNGGIQFRSLKLNASGQAKGYQADIGTNYNENVWGTLYHEHGRGLLNGSDAGATVMKLNQWNHYEILAIGHRIWIVINSAIVSATEDKGGELSGHLALQIHAGPPQTIHYRIRNLVHNPQITLAGLNEEQLNHLLRSSLVRAGKS